MRNRSYTSKGGFLFDSLLGEGMPLFAEEHVVKKLGGIFVTAVYLGRCARSHKSRRLTLRGVIDSRTLQSWIIEFIRLMPR